MAARLFFLTIAATALAAQDMMAADEEPVALDEPAALDASSVELSEGGYASVAALHSDEDMQIFMERVVVDQGLRVVDEQRFKDVVPFYSGACATQSLEAMMQELQKGEKPSMCKGPWLARDGESGSFLRQAAPREGMATMLYNLLFRPRPTTANALKALQTSLLGAEHIGMWAAIDEMGYLAVASEGNPHEMFLFVRRVLKEEKLSVSNVKMLERMLPYYDGTCEVQSLSAMVSELRHAVNQDEACFGGPWVKRTEA